MLRHFAAGTTTAATRGSEPGSCGAAPQLFLLVCLAAAICAVFVAPAFAAQTHPYTGTSFGPDGVGGTESFKRVQSLAVDPANGDTYVYDGGAGKIYKFNSSGAPLNFSASGTNAISGVGGGGGGAEEEIALAPAGSPAGTAGNIYVANNGQAIHVYSPAGTELGELDQGGETCGVATDAAGNFYAGVYSSTINKYTPSANPPINADKTATGSASVGLCNVAADGLGNVYAANFGGGGLYKLEGIGDTTPTKVDSGANTMAIAPGSNDLYADHGNEVFQYDSAGNPIGSFGNGQISESHGVAVNSGASKIYVGTSTKVKVFGPSTIVPDATTEASDAITKTTATLHGTVGAAGGPDATCVFQYVTESAFFEHGFEGASEKPCSPAGPFSGSGTTAVSATATGLSTTTGYRFRLLATSSAGSNGGQALSFFTPGAVNVQTDPATGVTDSAAMLNGTINPEGVELEECTFEYRTGFGSFESAPCAEGPSTIGSGNAPVPVHLDLTGLTGGSEYQFRLVGKNEFGTNQGGDKFFKAKGPSVGSESVSGVTETTAGFHAKVNPNGVDTSFVFEYVTQADFEASGYAEATSVPAGGEDIGDGSGDVEVSAEATGLVAKTSYRFRVAATSVDGVTRGSGVSFATRGPSPLFGSCPNEGFRSGQAALLPDCRAYEQASPADKKGAGISGIRGFLRAAPLGSGVTFFNSAGNGFPSQTGGNQTYGTYLASRSEGSWATQRLMAPQSYGASANSAWLGSTPDLRYSVVQVEDPAYPSAEFGRGLFLIDTTDGEITTIVPREENELQVEYAFDGASKDGSRIFFETKAALTPDAEDYVDNLYMWSRSTGEVTLAGLLPAAEGGEEPESGSFGGAYEWFEENEPSVGGALHGLGVEALHAISPDGDQIYFTAGETGQLYLRHGLTGTAPETVHVSEPATGAPAEPPRPAAFQEATPDGSKAFFLSSQKLTADATTGPSNEGKDLYRWDAASEELVDIAPDSGDVAGAQVQGLVGIAEDGRSGYFVAKGSLATGATIGSPNLYRFAEAGSSFTITYVATLAPKSGEPNIDQRNYSPRLYAGPPSNPDRYDNRSKTSRTLSDGSDLLFTSSEPLTGYDNTTEQNSSEAYICNQGEEHRCGEVYLYSAAIENVTCISCNPTGEPPLGPGQLSSEYFNTSLTPNNFPNVSLPRNLSADGDHIFFESADPLVPEDTNAAAGCTSFNEVNAPETSRDCLDVYEWEAPDTPGGSCQAAEANGGCLYLLSSGKSESGSYFLDASEDGSSAFIGTTSKLVPADRDSLYDAYDVRAGGGLASQFQVATPPCEGEACHGPASPTPAVGNPASSQFQGPGNAKPHKNKKKSHKKKRHQKKHHKARHGSKHRDRSANTSKGGR